MLCCLFCARLRADLRAITVTKMITGGQGKDEETRDGEKALPCPD